MNHFEPYLQMCKAISLATVTVSLGAINSVVGICVGVLSGIYLWHQILKIRAELKARKDAK